MRDILLTLIIFGSLPLIIKTPAIGGLMWVWVSVMNPHTMSWGFAMHFPFAMTIAIATLLSVLLTRERKSLPLTPITWTLIMFVLWMNVTTSLALFPHTSFEQLNKVMKIMLMTFVILMVIKKKEDIHRLIWVLVISLGYYGVKGGLFTIRTGGSERVWGPEGTFIDGNNEIALALIMTIPLMYYLQQNSTRKWVQRGLTAMMLLSALAALGSYSRGALLAIAAMVIFMWFKSSKKIVLGVLIALATPMLLFFMPAGWVGRMDSISNYQTDESAQGRLNAWRMAYNLAKDRFCGGGFSIYEPSVFSMYAPDPNDVHAAHSIYFQALGEHGFVGLALYLLLGILTWRSGAWIIRNTQKVEHLRWALSLASMIQASLVGFAVGGAFLSLLYFDVPYYLMAAIVTIRVLVEQELRGASVACILATDKLTPPFGAVVET